MENEATIQELLDDLAKKVETYNTIPRSVEKSLEASGLKLNPQATPDTPELPSDISALNLQQLNLLYDRFALYYDFVSRKLSQAETNLLTVKRLLKLLDAALHFKYKTDTRLTAAKDRTNAIVLDWEYVKADAQECYFRGIVDALDHHRSVTAQGRDRVYREISRRTQKEKSFSSRRGSLLKGD